MMDSAVGNSASIGHPVSSGLLASDLNALENSDPHMQSEMEALEENFLCEGCVKKAVTELDIIKSKWNEIQEKYQRVQSKYRTLTGFDDVKQLKSMMQEAFEEELSRRETEKQNDVRDMLERILTIVRSEQKLKLSNDMMDHLITQAFLNKDASDMSAAVAKFSMEGK